MNCVKLSLTFLLSAFCVAFASEPLSAAVVPVSDSAGFQQALNSATEGSVIELAAGTYPAPLGGFTLFNPTAGFTVRAAAGAVVIFDGASATDILRFTNSTKPVTFQGIAFLNGLSNSNFIGGAITLDHVEATFVACTFQNNAANASTTGGAGLWINAAKVLFQSCVFNANHSLNYGAAFSALDSQVFMNGTRFTNNVSNPANHHMNSAGGAILANASLLRIANCKFDGNQAGLAGGAIYAYGPWKDPVGVPVTQLIVANSTFTGNRAERGSGGPAQSPPTGGAVFSEDQVTSQFFNCRFTGNIARLGGALASYRAIVEVVGCVFKGNQATGTAADESIGGAISSLSSDNTDGSTNGGKINRRSSDLTVRDTLIQGVPGTNSAGRGGGIFASGDLAAAYGIPPFAQNGSLDFNRAKVTLTRVAFVDLTANGDNAIGSGLGGALQGDFASITGDQVIVANCNATNYGGGFRFGQNCAVTLTNSTITQVTAAFAGAGVTMFSGALNLKNCNFSNNSISSGTVGTAITTGAQPAGGGVPALDVTGLIDSCIFTNNGTGPAIYDSEPFRSGPFDRVQYSANQFYSPTFEPYFSDIVGPQSVPALNALSVNRADGSVDKKAPSPNFAPTTAPSFGAILMLPTNSLRSGDPDEAIPISANLVFASNGVGGVKVDGVAQRANYGVMTNVADGAHTLTVGASSYTTTPPPGTALNIATRLQVGNGQQVLIGGFIIQGPNPKRILLRAIGPSLPFAGVLQDPYLELHDQTGAIVGTNDNWKVTNVGGVIPAGQAVEIAGTTIPPSHDMESAIVATLPPGSYTAVVRGATNDTGIAVIEGYDLDPEPVSKLANISTRGFVLTGDNVMIGGFIYGGGPGPTKVMVRGLGPSLAAFGVANPLMNPMLEIHNSNGATVDSNDDWITNRGPIEATGLQPSDNTEAACLLTNLTFGAYTAVLRSAVNAIGVGIVEVYVFQ
jgi:hypothetical protein